MLIIFLEFWHYCGGRYRQKQIWLVSANIYILPAGYQLLFASCQAVSLESPWWYLQKCKYYTRVLKNYLLFLGLGFWLHKPSELLNLGFWVLKPSELLNPSFLGTETIWTVESWFLGTETIWTVEFWFLGTETIWTIESRFWIQKPSELFCCTLDTATLRYPGGLTTGTHLILPGYIHFAWFGVRFWPATAPYDLDSKHARK